MGGLRARQAVLLLGDPASAIGAEISQILCRCAEDLLRPVAAQAERRQALLKSMRPLLLVALGSMLLTTAPAIRPALVGAAELTVEPFAELPGMGGQGDNVDDPAIGSRHVFGVGKDGLGLFVYDLAGRQVAHPDSGDFDNVDVRPGFKLGSETIELVGLSDVGEGRMNFYRADTYASVGSVDTANSIYGFCMGRVGDSFYAIGPGKGGPVEVFRLDGSSGAVEGTRVRSFSPGGVTEGCAVDDAKGVLLVTSEPNGVYRTGLGSGSVKQFDSTGSGGDLVADVEGVDVDGKHIVVSSQGESSFALYDRETYTYLGEFQVEGADETDGVDLDAAKNLLVVHDHSPSRLLYVKWHDVLSGIGGGDSGELPEPEPVPTPKPEPELGPGPGPGPEPIPGPEPAPEPIPAPEPTPTDARCFIFSVYVVEHADGTSDTVESPEQEVPCGTSEMLPAPGAGTGTGPKAAANDTGNQQDGSSDETITSTKRLEEGGQ
jgi:myo-inositol-hexaphosphate 3-phosphohydrolase